VRNAWTRANLGVPQILPWADPHHDWTGQWPIADSGSIPEAAGETWRAVSLALFKGGRGLPRGSSLARLLAAERDVPNRLDLPRLTCQQILVWANDHRRHTGEWPTRHSGPIRQAPNETWHIINEVGGRQWLADGMQVRPGDGPQRETTRPGR